MVLAYTRGTPRSNKTWEEEESNRDLNELNFENEITKLLG
jgi:hypothetical protein